MGKFIDIKFLPAPKNDAGGQAAGQKLKSMAGDARDEKPGYEGVFSGRPLEQQEVVEILDVWDKESSWRAKEMSPDQEQVRKLLDGICEGAGLDISSLKAFKNQFLLDSDFTPALDEGIMRMEIFLLPTCSNETGFQQTVMTVLGSVTSVTTGWSLKEAEYDSRGWRALLMLTKWESLAQSETALSESSRSLNAILEQKEARTLVHHIKWKNPLTQVGLAVSGGVSQTG